MPATKPALAAPRLQSIDLLRGAVMLLMVIDHVRVYAGVPAGGPTAGVFFTRWVTHFCAPAFLFLAGTSAYLSGLRLASRAQLSRRLLLRGLGLVVLELTAMRFFWTFNFDYAHYSLAGVIWAIGWCMVLMAALVWLPDGAVAALGLAIVLGHNLMDSAPQLAERMFASPFARLWTFLYFGGEANLGSDRLPVIVLYSIVPWIGVMACGYAFARVLLLEPERRRRACLAIGLGAVAAFLLLRGFDLYGDPRPWRSARPEMPPLFAFLATTKYPASLLFLLMTLGPSIALMPALEKARGRVAYWVATIGKVPLFFYVLHIPLIHVAAIVVSLLRTGAVDTWLFANFPAAPPPPPEGYTWSLPLLYLVAAVVCVLLYFPCRWYATRRSRARGTGLAPGAGVAASPAT